MSEAEIFRKITCRELALLGDGLDCVVDERTPVRSESYLSQIEALRTAIRAAEKEKGCKDERSREDRY